MKKFEDYTLNLYDDNGQPIMLEWGCHALPGMSKYFEGERSREPVFVQATRWMGSDVILKCKKCQKVFYNDRKTEIDFPLSASVCYTDLYCLKCQPELITRAML